MASPGPVVSVPPRPLVPHPVHVTGAAPTEPFVGPSMPDIWLTEPVPLAAPLPPRPVNVAPGAIDTTGLSIKTPPPDPPPLEM